MSLKIIPSLCVDHNVDNSRVKSMKRVCPLFESNTKHYKAGTVREKNFRRSLRRRTMDDLIRWIFTPGSAATAATI